METNVNEIYDLIENLSYEKMLLERFDGIFKKIIQRFSLVYVKDESCPIRFPESSLLGFLFSLSSVKYVGKLHKFFVDVLPLLADFEKCDAKDIKGFDLGAIDENFEGFFLLDTYYVPDSDKDSEQIQQS